MVCINPFCLDLYSRPKQTGRFEYKTFFFFDVHYNDKFGNESLTLKMASRLETFIPKWVGSHSNTSPPPHPILRYTSIKMKLSVLLVLRKGAIIKWRNMKNWKDTEQYSHHDTIPQHQETPRVQIFSVAGIDSVKEKETSCSMRPRRFIFRVSTKSYWISNFFSTRLCYKHCTHIRHFVFFFCRKHFKQAKTG